MPFTIAHCDTWCRLQDDPSAPLESFNKADYLEVNRSRQHSGPYGHYPWDHWGQWAREDGVPEELAQLGRSLIREADQHSWTKRLQAECGWQDSGQAMIQLALRDPGTARRRLEYLLQTDGERVPYPDS